MRTYPFFSLVIHDEMTWYKCSDLPSAGTGHLMPFCLHMFCEPSNLANIVPSNSISPSTYILRMSTARRKKLLQMQLVSMPHPRILSRKSSFIPKACNLWNVLSSCFPESYNLPFFKSKINKLDLISLSS